MNEEPLIEVEEEVLVLVLNELVLVLVLNELVLVLVLNELVLVLEVLVLISPALVAEIVTPTAVASSTAQNIPKARNLSAEEGKKADLPQEPSPLRIIISIKKSE